MISQGKMHFSLFEKLGEIKRKVWRPNFQRVALVLGELETANFTCWSRLVKNKLSPLNY